MIKNVKLLVKQGTVITVGHFTDLWKKSKNLREKAVNVVDEREDLPKSYEIVGDNHVSVRTFRNVVISGQGKASEKFHVPHLKSQVYVSMDDTFVLPKSANNDKDRAVYITQVQEAFTNFVKELEKCE